jgi:S-adenosylmethionine synthetase
MVNGHGTAVVDEEKIEACVKELFDLTPRGIIESLKLMRPIYRKTAAYGHFGRELPEFTWEKTDRVDEIRDFLGL